MTDPRLAPLAAIAGLMRDQALAGLSREVQACAELRARLAALEVTLPEDPVVSAAALEAAVLRHERWVASRRRQLNEQLALRSAARLEAEAKARAAFGRALVLETLARTRR